MKLTTSKDVLIPLLSCSRIIAFVNIISANLTVRSSSLLEDCQKMTPIYMERLPTWLHLEQLKVVSQQEVRGYIATSILLAVRDSVLDQLIRNPTILGVRG
jgi:hypothetical protein